MAPSGHFGHAQRCLLSGVKRWTFRNVRFLRPVLVLLLMPTGLVEAIEHRQDILNIFGVGVRIIKGIEQRVVLGTQLFIQVIDPLKKCFSFLAVFLLSSLNHLRTETVDLAIRLGLGLIAADIAHGLLRIRLQLGRVRSLSLRPQRHR